MPGVEIVGGGIAGLAAAITCAEAGVKVRLREARSELGGRGQSIAGPYRANLGPHALYSDGVLWDWLGQRRLRPPTARPPSKGMRWHLDGRPRRVPPVRMLARAQIMRPRRAPVEEDFRTWCSEVADPATAAQLSAASAVFAFTHDPGSLSAAFVWERAKRVLLRFPPAARYPLGGWRYLIERLSLHARRLGVQIETGDRVATLADPPVIVATDLPAARRLLDDPSLHWASGHTLCLDLGLVARRGDPFIVSDLDNGGWIERFSAADSCLAPRGEQLVQAQLPLRCSEPPDEARTRLEHTLDATFADWRLRTTWQRRLVMRAQTGALDAPGTTWRDRPAIDRGDGVFLAGDMVAAPGLLAEVALNSALAAARQAVAYLRPGGPAPDGSARAQPVPGV